MFHIGVCVKLWTSTWAVYACMRGCAALVGLTSPPTLQRYFAPTNPFSLFSGFSFRVIVFVFASVLFLLPLREHPRAGGFLPPILPLPPLLGAFTHGHKNTFEYNKLILQPLSLSSPPTLRFASPPIFITATPLLRRSHSHLSIPTIFFPLPLPRPRSSLSLDFTNFALRGKTVYPPQDLIKPISSPFGSTHPFDTCFYSDDAREGYFRSHPFFAFFNFTIHDVQLYELFPFVRPFLVRLPD
ncbi:hypothetical protein BD410DRAFT_43525 [Rickenella mellea]|uniref:Uncharacterized protein n=1 Tax=Rickenella mellea TaxID=50990 RepID=A0A4R5XGU1_9AGAM|nr:hypothetical protein BD410DRAFT_43525 [Rickenella mellea]